MKAKLRKVGNSLGITIPSTELRALGASDGDMLEVEVLKVISAARSGWDTPEVWNGGGASEVLIDVDNQFDEGEWEW